MRADRWAPDPVEKAGRRLGGARPAAAQPGGGGALVQPGQVQVNKSDRQMMFEVCRYR